LMRKSRRRGFGLPERVPAQHPRPNLMRTRSAGILMGHVGIYCII
jgi:hypothetical protein